MQIVVVDEEIYTHSAFYASSLRLDMVSSSNGLIGNLLARSKSRYLTCYNYLGTSLKLQDISLVFSFR